MRKENNLIRNFIIGTFITLYVMVSIISTIHVIDFFELSNPKWLAVTLAIAFEVGAAASLASIIALKKMNKGIVWALFIVLTLMQAMGNTYYAFVNLKGFEGWIELFGLVDEDLVQQKRIVSFISGAVLPLVALGFIKSLVDYIRPDDEVIEEVIEESKQDNNLNDEAKKVWGKVDELRKEGKLPEITEEDLADEPTALAFTPHEHFEEDINEEILESDDEDGEIGFRDEDHKEALKKYVKNLIDEINSEPENEPLPIDTEDTKEEITNDSEETPNDEDKENYPVYDNSDNATKNNALDNIMVFTKNVN